MRLRRNIIIYFIMSAIYDVLVSQLDMNRKQGYLYECNTNVYFY